MKEYRLDNSPIVYYVSDNGHKSWVMFLHAAFADHRMFDTQIDSFGEKFNVIVPDLIGHGASVQTQKGDGIGKMSKRIYEILQKHAIAKIHLAGVSIGAVLAQDFANKYPQCVASLACFGGYDINNFDSKMQRENGSAQMFMMLKALVSVKWFAEANKKISAYTPEAQQAFYEMNIRFPKKSFMYLAGLNGMVNVCKTGERGYPLLIGCGEHDVPMAHAAVNMWKETESRAEVAVIPGAGHCANMDVPERFNQTLMEFMNKAEN